MVFHRPIVIAPTIGCKFPATELPILLWIGIWIQLLQMMLTSESNEPLEGCWGYNAELTPSLQKKMSAGCSLPRRWKCCSVSPGCGEESQPESAPNGHWRNYWMEDSKLHGKLLPGYWLCAVLMSRWCCPHERWQGTGE